MSPKFSGFELMIYIYSWSTLRIISKLTFSALLLCFKKALLANGANVNAANKYGWTSLIEAAWGGHNNVVEVLIHGGMSNEN